MSMYRNVYLLPRFLKRPDQLFHSAASQLVRVEPFRARAEHTTTPPTTTPLQPLTQVHAADVVRKLNAAEREALRLALLQFETDSVATKLEGELAAGRWQANSTLLLANLYVPDSRDSKASKTEEAPKASPSQCEQLAGGVKLAVQPPSRQDLLKLMVVNSVPFVGFGFLDNFLMIIAGDYIESTLGVYMCISTMAAAALGNTISDVMGLGLAHYVEALCLFLGMRPPKLTAEQIDGKACRRVMSYGRALGITIGCIIGMIPLYFMNKKPKTKEALLDKSVESPTSTASKPS